MVNWTLMPDHLSSNSWNEYLLQFPDFNLYQHYGWGEYKRYFQWVPFRFIARNEKNEVVAMAQCLYKSFPFGGMIWCPGGPVGNISAFNDALIDICKNVTGKKRLYIRFDSYRNTLESRDLALMLMKKGWKRPAHKINSNVTMVLNLEPCETELIKNFTKNWRHNLKRFRNNSLTVKRWENIDVDEILEIYTCMEKFKGLSATYSPENLRYLFQIFHDQILMYRCIKKDGELVAFRGAFVWGKKAWDFFAAANDAARKLYASHHLFWTLLCACKNLGVSSYDMSGIDPVKNPGVYNFKKGTGAVKVQNLGEWEWANSHLFRFLIDFGIKLRGGMS